MNGELIKKAIMNYNVNKKVDTINLMTEQYGTSACDKFANEIGLATTSELIYYSQSYTKMSQVRKILGNLTDDEFILLFRILREIGLQEISDRLSCGM